MFHWPVKGSEILSGNKETLYRVVTHFGILVPQNSGDYLTREFLGNQHLRILRNIRTKEIFQSLLSGEIDIKFSL